MLELADYELVFRFPDVHKNAVCHIRFMRTLRVPDDNQVYDLPAGLDMFRVVPVKDVANKLPVETTKTGGVLIPMYQSEALWIHFESSYPFAVQIATGNKDAITGNDWSEKLSKSPQNYVVLPDQKWIDGFCVGNGLVRQFVAMPLGQGYSVEEQLGGTGDVGGIQIRVVPLRSQVYNEEEDAANRTLYSRSPFMGIAPGGIIKQQIYSDSRLRLDVYDEAISQTCFVHIVNSKAWRKITGQRLPSQPITKAEYKYYGIPWFTYYDEALASVFGSPTLKRVQSVAAKHIVNTGKPLDDNSSMEQGNTFNIGKIVKKIIDGDW